MPEKSLQKKLNACHSMSVKFCLANMQSEINCLSGNYIFTCNMKSIDVCGDVKIENALSNCTCTPCPRSTVLYIIMLTNTMHHIMFDMIIAL